MKNCYFLVGLFLFFSQVSLGQKADKKVNELSNPRAVVENHLKYLQRDSYKPAQSAKSLKNKRITSEIKYERRAIQLKQILDGKGIYVELEEIPNKPDYVDTTSGEAKFTISPLLPQVYLVKQNQQWVYSKYTVEAIPELHEDVYPYGLDEMLNLVPESWHTRFLGLEIGQYIGLLFIIIISFLFHKLLSLLFGRVLYSILHRINSGFISSLWLKKVARPLSWFLLLRFVAQLVPALLLPVYISKYIIIALNILVPVAGTLVFYNLVGLLAEFFNSLAQKTESTLDDQLIPLVRKLLKLLVILVGAAYILDSLGYDYRPYLVGLSFGGLAFAFAAKDTVSNLFGSAMIFIDRPFQIGDWINYSGMDGTVEEVGFRSTRMRTFHNSVISIPNGKLADNPIDNYGLRSYRRYSAKISITYDTPPAMIDVFVQGIRGIVAEHPHSWKDFYEVHLTDLGSDSLQVLLYMFFDAKTYSLELKYRHEINMGILKLADQLGIRFAFPTQTLHIESTPDKSATPKGNIDVGDLENKKAAFLAAFKQDIQSE